MKKRYCRALSITIVVLLVFSLVSFASEIGEPVLRTSQISFLDDEGTALSQLKVNSKVTARLTAKGTAGKDVKASFILAYYEYGFLKSLKSYDSSVSQSEEITMEVSVTTGSKPERGKLKAFLWESYEGSTILSKSAEFGSKNANVSDILLNGIPLKGFSPEISEYKVILPASSLDYPDIQAVTGDLAADVQIIKQEFPSEVEIKVVSSDKSTYKSYRIQFSRQDAAVSNVIMHYTSGATDLTVSAVSNNAQNPEFVNPVPNGITEGALHFGVSNLKSFTRCVYDRDTYLINLPEYLLGSTVIAGSQNETRDVQKKAQIKDINNKKLMTFDLNASADIYYMMVAKGTESSLLSHAPWLVEYGFQYVENLPNWIEAAIDVPKIRDGSVFKKTVTVENGETQTVTLGGNDYAFTTPIAFVVWKTREDVAQLKDITLDGRTLDGFSPDITEYEYMLSATQLDIPEIEVTPLAEGAQITVMKDEGNKKAIIRVTSINGKETNEYTIQFRDFQPSVSNVTLYGEGGVSKDITEEGRNLDIREPAFMTGSPDDKGYYELNAKQSDGSYHTNVSACSKMVYDRGTYLIDIPQQWIGSTIIAGSQDAASSSKGGAYRSYCIDGNNSKVLSFTIDNSAHIYYIYPGKQNDFSRVKWAEKEGYEMTDIVSGWVEGGNAGAVPHADRMTVFQKTIEVEKGGTKTVNIGGAEGMFTSPIAVIEWFYPEKEAELKEIKINGAPFEDFHTDILNYTQPFPAGTSGMPDVTAVPTVEGASVQVSADNKTTVITVTSADGTVSKTYRITFAVIPTVSNIYMHYGTQETPNDVDIKANALTDLRNPVFQAGKPEDTGYYEFANVESSTKLIYDRNTYLMEIPDSLVGCPMIAGSQSAAKDKVYGPVIKDKNNGGILSFDINASANIYYILYATSPSYTNIPWAETAGFVPTDIKMKWVEGANPGAQPKTNLVVYKKTVNVEEGNMQTVHIGGCDGAFTSPSIVIEWTDAKSVAELSSISMDGQIFQQFSRDITEYTIELPEGQTELPEVTAQASEGGASVEVLTNGNDVTVRVTSENGSNWKEYILHFVIQKPVTPEVTDVTMHFGNVTKAVTAIDTNIQEPVFADDKLSGSDLYRYTNLISKTKLISDRETYLIDIPQNLLGQTIISGSQTDAKSNAAYVKDGSNGGLMTFDINCTANIYYFLYANAPSYANIAWAEAAGFIPTDLSVKWVEGKGAEPIAPKTNLVLYKKTVEVPKGQKVTVSIGGQNDLFTCPSVIIEWIQ